jgi:hypothetical protein
VGLHQLCANKSVAHYVFLVGKNADNLPSMNSWTSKVNKVNDFGLLFAEMSSIAQAFFAFFLSA